MAAGEVGDKNAFVVGTREDNTILARYFGEGAVPAGGYAIRTLSEGDRSLALMCGSDEVNTIYAVVDYLERTRIFRGTSTPHSSPKPHFK